MRGAGDYEKFTALTRDGKIARGEDWWAIKDTDGSITSVDHIDRVLERYQEGMEVAFLGRGRNYGLVLEYEESAFKYKTRAAVEAIRDERKRAYQRDIHQYGTLSLHHDSFYIVHPHHKGLVFDPERSDWVSVPAAICMACSTRNGCWIH